ncbi:MAG: CoA transferase [Acetobacteraceae bacterium]|nr:CoA transferase [Acetobacteraceae bacterium]
MPSRDAWKPFAGLRVLDASQGFAGPSCAAMLAAQGADVVKVEPPGGDWARHIGRRHGDNTAFGLVPNIGKRGICLDAARPAGRALLRRLALAADVVVHNFREAAAERLGIGATQLRAESPAMVHLTITGFGVEGDWAGRAATDTILQGFTGLMTLVGGEGQPPRRVDFSLIDVVAGVHGAQRISAALFRRAQGDGGATLSISLLEVATALQAAPLLDRAVADATGEPCTPPPLGVPLGVFATADGHINLSCIGDRMFAAIARVLGQDEWLEDPSLATAALRLARAGDISATTQRIIGRKPTAHWVEAFTAADVLCGPIQDHGALLRDRQARAVRLFEVLALPALGIEVPVARPPGGPPRGIALRAPALGEHTRAVLAEAGLAPEEIAGLLADGTVREEA